MTNIKMGLTIEEAAEMSGIGRNTMRKLVDWGKLPVLLCIKCKDSAHTPRKALQILPDSCKMVTTIFLRKGTDYETFFCWFIGSLPCGRRVCRLQRQQCKL